ncbi:MAG: hypothetical protein JXR70_07585 [Spirochaetales bacterium]|nr:hypothetical protein [Spirochaetales bacterium]
MKKQIIFIILMALISLSPLLAQQIGNVNSDDKINIVDALLVAQYYIGLEPENFYPEFADVNCSSNINIVDSLLIAQYYIALISEFECHDSTLSPTDEPTATPNSSGFPDGVEFKAFTKLGEVSRDFAASDVPLEIIPYNEIMIIRTYGYLKFYDMSDPADPVLVNTYPKNEDMSIKGCAISGDYLYVTATVWTPVSATASIGETYFYVFDARDFSAPLSGIAALSGEFQRLGKLVIHGNWAVSASDNYLYTFDISNPEQPFLLSSTYINNYNKNPGDILFYQNHIILAKGKDGIFFFDFSDPAKPLLVSHYDTPGDARDLELSDNKLFVADYQKSLQIIDISDLLHPELITKIDLPLVTVIWLQGNQLYCDGGNSGTVSIYDISDVTSPVELFEINQSYSGNNESIADIYQEGVYLFTLHKYKGLNVHDISDLKSPIWIANTDFYGEAKQIIKHGPIVFCNDTYSGVEIFDFTDPLEPRLLSRINPLAEAVDSLDYKDNLLFLACGREGLFIYDVSDLAAPLLIGRYLSIPPDYELTKTRNYLNFVKVSGNYAILPFGSNLFEVLDLSDPANPEQVYISESINYGISVQIKDNYAFFMTGNPMTQYKLLIVDISDFHNPSVVGSYTTFNLSSEFSIYGDYLFAHLMNGEGINVIDISNPPLPKLVKNLPINSDRFCWTVSGHYLFLSNDSRIIEVYNIDDFENLIQVETYDLFEVLESPVSWVSELLVEDNTLYVGFHDSPMVLANFGLTD